MIGRIFKWLFTTGEKDDEAGTVEGVSEEPRVAYVTRLEPKEYEGHHLKGKCGAYENIISIDDDLIPAIENDSGGGRYQAKLYKMVDRTSTGYLGNTAFEISGTPLKNGKEIEPKEKKEKSGVSSFDKKIEEAHKRAELVEAEAKVRAAEEKHGLNQPVVDAGPDYNPEVEELKRELERMKEEREKDKEEMRRQREDDRFEKLLTVLAGKDNGKNDSLEAIRMMMESNNRHMDAMIAMGQKNTDKSEAAYQALLKDKAGANREALAMSSEFLKLGMMAGRGQTPDEPEDTLIGLANNLGGQVIETINNFLETRKGTKIDGEELGQLVSDQVKGALAGRALPSGPAPAARANPADNVRSAMDGVIDRLAEEVQSGVPEAEQTWMMLAQQSLPAEVLTQVAANAQSVQGLKSVVHQYASPDRHAVADAILDGRMAPAEPTPVVPPAPRVVRKPQFPGSKPPVAKKKKAAPPVKIRRAPGVPAAPKPPAQKPSAAKPVAPEQSQEDGK